MAEQKIIAIVRIRGNKETRGPVESTIMQLHLTRKNHCVLQKDTIYLRGMLKHAKDYIAWGEVDAKTVESLFVKMGKTEGDKKLTDEYVAKNSKFKTVKEFSDAVFSGTASWKDVKGLKPIFRLHPPLKGYGGSIKLPFPKGALGNRKDKMGALLQRMIPAFEPAVHPEENR